MAFHIATISLCLLVAGFTLLAVKAMGAQDAAQQKQRQQQGDSGYVKNWLP